MKKTKNYLDLYRHKFGNERRYEFLNETLENQSLIPSPVKLIDIDKSFKEWADKEVSINSPEGNKMPTISLYSSRRFSEYSQSWEYVDENKNLLLNFKTVMRANNPQWGGINSRLYNIPGDEFFTYKKLIVLDDNGSESFKVYKMKTPTACDLSYTLSVFTTKFEKVNEFNEKINRMFSSRQVYINPNGHYMPMVVESISDNSSYNINDREFYSQTVTIKVMGYILLEEDFLVEEIPLKKGVMNVGTARNRKKKSGVTIEEYDEECAYLYEGEEKYYYKPIIITIIFPPCINVSKFKIDTDFTITDIKNTNIRHKPKLYINGNEALFEAGTSFVDYDEIKITINKKDVNKEAKIELTGYDRRFVYDKDNDYPEFKENMNKVEEIVIDETPDGDGNDGSETI